MFTVERLHDVVRYDRRLRHHLPAVATDLGDVVSSFEAAGCRRDSDDVPILLRMVALCAAQIEEDRCGRTSPDRGPIGDVSDPLRTWSENVGARWGIDAQLIGMCWSAAKERAARWRGKQTWAQVVITADNPDLVPGTASYSWTAWLADPIAGPQRLGADPGFRPWKQVSRDLAGLLEPLLADSRFDLAVEFFLAESQMELQVERIAVAYHETENVHLGALVPVVVRWHSRGSAGAPSAAHADRWESCAKDRTAGDHHWLVRDAKASGLCDELDRRPSVGCVELTGTLAHFTPALISCTRAGVPIVAWHRQLAGFRPSADLAQLRRGAHPYQLPEEVRQLREDIAITPGARAGHIVLLWADPRRQAPRYRLRSPGSISHS